MTDATLPANGQPADSEQTRDRRRPDAANPAGWFPPAGGEAAPSLRPGMEPARSDETAPPETVPPELVATETVPPETVPPKTVPPEPVATEPPVTALAAWWWAHTAPVPAAGEEPVVADPGDPGEPVVSRAAAALAGHDPVGRSGWQLAQQAWQESGIDWEVTDEEPQQPEPEESDRRYLEEGYLDPEPSSAALPLGAPIAPAPRVPWDGQVRTFPTMASASGGRQDDPAAALLAGAGPGWPGPTDELFRAWQGSVRKAAAPRRWQALAAPWRHRAWQAAKIGVPAAIIIGVGVGALIMLTGSANEVLANQAGSGSRPLGAVSATGISGPGTTAGGAAGSARVPPVAPAPVAPAPVALPGYPGERGTVSVDSMWSAADGTVAVGTADGHPAVWRRAAGAAGAAWTLESAGLLGAGPGALAAVTDGPAGWIAVGSVMAGGATEPTVLASADGVTWRPVLSIAELAGPGARFLGVAAGHDGYVVVGRQMTRGRTFAALWWSADLRTWTADGNGGLNGRLSASTANAVTATAGGFVAVGSHGVFPAIWTSDDGRNWNLHDLSVPPGARDASLSLVAAPRTSTSRVVAGGYAATSAGEVPVIVTSTDGGAGWHLIVLGTSGLVTALSATGNGFLAAGLSGTAGARQAVVWTSPDGLAWSAGTRAGNGAGEITALDVGGPAGAAATGAAATGSAATGADVITLPSR